MLRRKKEEKRNKEEKRKKEEKRNKENQRNRKSRNKVKKNRQRNKSLKNQRKRSNSNRRDKSNRRSRRPKKMICTNYPNAISELERLFGLRKIQIVRIYITKRLTLEVARSVQLPVVYRNS